MAILNKDAILKADDLKKEIVSVPEWGGEVIISAMTGYARDAWEQHLVQSKDNVLSNIRARLVVACAVDEEGNRLFTEGDVIALGEKSVAALERCVKVAQRLNRLTETDLDDLQKN
jgi:hypothetical protein